MPSATVPSSSPLESSQSSSKVKAPYVKSYKPVVIPSNSAVQAGHSRQPSLPTSHLPEASTSTVKPFTRNPKIVPFMPATAPKVNAFSQTPVEEPAPAAPKPKEPTKTVPFAWSVLCRDWFRCIFLPLPLHPRL